MPSEIQTAGVRASYAPSALRSREPIVMKQRFRASTSGDCSTQWIPSVTVSGLRRPNGTYDARTPAVWISNGTGRDGNERRGAPKVGWCWWRNRHTWLGFASTAARQAGPGE